MRLNVSLNPRLAGNHCASFCLQLVKSKKVEGLIRAKNGHHVSSGKRSIFSDIGVRVLCNNQDSNRFSRISGMFSSKLKDN
ncbi:hypothetical protein L1987_78257 [Smallanthus sonchifolius]|uniref:Uncharacterized protein n=1 Tax=Smallanthus sonchifolius TaxID=185202 RepID=A0ACB8ZCC9_9ASTR|nr:hypothetical protein L1987_78257 [Smallanthus sonchifolius]